MDINIVEEINNAKAMTREMQTTYQKLGPWEKVQVARQ